jgi:hypothetical protein
VQPLPRSRRLGSRSRSASLSGLKSSLHLNIWARESKISSAVFFQRNVSGRRSNKAGGPPIVVLVAMQL